MEKRVLQIALFVISMIFDVVVLGVLALRGWAFSFAGPEKYASGLAYFSGPAKSWSNLPPPLNSGL